MPAFVYDHIHVRSPNPEATAEWYRDKFDANLVRTPQPDNQPDRVDINMDGLMIFVAGKLPDGQEIDEPRDPHYGLDHFGLRVEDLDDTLSRLTSRGVEITDGPRMAASGAKIAFVRGPDNVRIELVQR